MVGVLRLAELVDLGDLRLAALAALRRARVGAGVVCRALVVDDVADLRDPLLLGRVLLDQSGVDPAIDGGATSGDRDQVDRMLSGRVECRDLRLAGLAARAGGGVRARVVDLPGVGDDVADLQIGGRLRRLLRMRRLSRLPGLVKGRGLLDALGRGAGRGVRLCRPGCAERTGKRSKGPRRESELSTGALARFPLPGNASGVLSYCIVCILAGRGSGESFPGAGS